MTARDLIKILEEKQWVEVRQKGSHKIFKHLENTKIISIPVHSGKDIPKGTLKSILKTAEIV